MCAHTVRGSGEGSEAPKCSSGLGRGWVSCARGRAAAEQPCAHLISLQYFPSHHNTNIITTGFSISQAPTENLLRGNRVRLHTWKLSLFFPGPPEFMLTSNSLLSTLGLCCCPSSAQPSGDCRTSLFPKPASCNHLQRDL